MSKMGMSQPKIVAELAKEKIKVAQSTVSSILKKLATTNSVSRRPGSGRHRKTTTHEDRKMKLSAVRNPRQTLTQLASQFTADTQKSISRQTVSRRLAEQGIFVYRCRRKPLLSAVNKAKRKAWVAQFWNSKKKQLKVPIDHFRKIIYSDESRFCLVPDRPQNCLRRPGEQLRPDCIQSTAKFGGGGLMVWGCLSSKGGIGPIDRVKGTMNADVYQEVLDENLIGHIKDAFPDRDFIFQQDGARCHTAKSTLKWFEEHQIPIVKDWPPQSPDLSIIENVWDTIGRKLSTEHFNNQNDLWEAIKVAYYSIKPEYIESLIVSLEHRFKAVAQNHGGCTDY